MPLFTHSVNVKRAKRYLTGGGVLREDSDDELGFEDHPWQWIYASPSPHQRPPAKAKVNGEAPGRKIVGAKMGNFECRLGDCMLLKADMSTNEAWVGIICEFFDDGDEEKVASFMWFSTEKEIRNKQKKRADALPVR